MKYIPKFQQGAEIRNYKPSPTLLVTKQPKSVSYPITLDNRSIAEKANNFAKRNTIGLRSWANDVGAPAVTMAGLATPFAPLALTTLINQAEKNGLPAEVSNTAFNRFVKPQNYTSELAGGLFDFKQSYEAAKQGNWWWNKQGAGAIPNAFWGAAGMIEIPKLLKQVPIFRQIDQADNFVEWSKAAGDSADLVWSFTNK